MTNTFLDLIPVVPYEDIRAGRGIVVHVADVDAHNWYIATPT